jgi:hypothetical protein
MIIIKTKERGETIPLHSFGHQKEVQVDGIGGLIFVLGLED